MIWFYKKRGFTLLELMIVVIIVGILASLAIPRFIEAARRARRGAATQMLASLRGAQMRYYAEYSVYTSAIGNLDLSMTASPDWTVVANSTSALLGKATHTDTSEEYHIAENGSVTP